MRLDKEAFSALIKLLIFLVITGLASLLLMTILANGLFRNDTQYSAEFRDVTGVAKGDDVRIAGVPVGRVEEVKVIDRNRALVTFGVDADRPLTNDTFATLKFRNLVGQRYLALSQGAEGNTGVMKPGSTIPASRTKDALDLNVLLNGFKPVFQALSPDDTNKLAFEIVQVLQGESSNVAALLGRTASLTSTLANRDQLIGDVITNLSETLDIVGQRDAELSETIVTLQQFVTGLNGDRDAILNSLDSISGLATETATLLDQGRPALAADIQQLDALGKSLTSGDTLQVLDRNIQILPPKLRKLTASASYESQFNFFVCGLSVTADILGNNVVLPGDLLPPVGGARCERTPMGDLG